MPAVTYLDFDLLIEPAPPAEVDAQANPVTSADAAGAIAQAPGAGGYRARVLASPAGEAECDFDPPFSQQELEIFVLRVIGLGTRRRVRRIEAPEMQTVKAFGAKLFGSVFSNGVHDCLVRSLDEADRSDAGLRLRVRLSGTPDLANVPWEYLYDPALNRFFCLSDRTPLVRYVDLPSVVRPLTVAPPLRVLAMISSPRDYPELDTEAEWSKLEKSLDELQGRGRVNLERMDSATLPNLQHRLRSGQYHIFHFIGHGGFDDRAQDGVLLLEDVAGKGEPVSGRDLGILLHDHRSLRLAVLNACEGARTSPTDPFAGAAQSLIQQGIPAVIAMQFEFSDEAAITFSQEFYGALGESLPVDAALAEARKAISTQINAVEWGTPVLYMRSPDGRIFDLEDRGRDALIEQPAAGEKAEVSPVSPPQAPPAGRIALPVGPESPRGGRKLPASRWVMALGLVLALAAGAFLVIKLASHPHPKGAGTIPSASRTPIPVASGLPIALVIGNEGSRSIQLVNADGTGIRDLVLPQGDNVDPAWSKDHKELAFANKALGEDRYHIYFGSLSEGTWSRLRHSPDNERFPAWSPDGRTIAFATGPPGHFSVFAQSVNDTGGQFRDTSMADWHPTWSPSERGSIAFARSDAEGGLYKVRGGTLIRLTSDPTDSRPSWGPGDRIVFQRGCCLLYVVSGNGGAALPLGVMGAGPSWSSDGKQILYHVGREIWVVEANGSNAHRVYVVASDNPEPAW
jgi:hypothetical protein